jgi:hypothetical protein
LQCRLLRDLSRPHAWFLTSSPLPPLSTPSTIGIAVAGD